METTNTRHEIEIASAQHTGHVVVMSFEVLKSGRVRIERRVDRLGEKRVCVSSDPDVRVMTAARARHVWRTYTGLGYARSA